MRDVIRTRHAVRLGFRQVKGLAKADMEVLVERRGGGYRSVRELWLRSGLSASVIERLAAADAFRSMGLDRRQALWEAKALDARGALERLSLFEAPGRLQEDNEQKVDLPAMPEGEHVIHDYRTLSLSLKAHPVSFLRGRLDENHVLPNGSLAGAAAGGVVSVAGLVLVRQRPGSAKGVIFMTIEDETGVANIIVWRKTFGLFRSVVLGARFVRVTGRLQSESDVIHVVAARIEDLTPWLGDLAEAASRIGGLANADEVKRPVAEGRDRPIRRARLARMVKDDPELRNDLETLARQAGTAMPKGRNFQ
jgi:error-prone DNA polymerase